MQWIAPILVFVLPICGLVILWALHLIYSRLPPTPHIRPFQLCVKIFAWFLILLGLFAPMAATFIGLALIIVTIVILLMAFVQFRRQERRALLWMLAVSAQRGLPLSAAARSFAAERTDGVGRRAMQLADQLDAGVPLPDALIMSWNRLPTDAEVTTRLEHETGGLGLAMLDASRDAANRQRLWRPMMEKSLYFLLLTIFAAAIFTFMLLKVVPAFHEIFYDFDVDLPSITQWIFDVSQWFNTWFWLLIPVKLFLLPVCVVAALYYIGVLRWEPWPIRAFTRPFHRATVLLALARTAEAGRPLTKTFQLLAQWYPQPAIRNRLGRVAKQVDQGQSWVRAMRSTRLLSASDAGVLHAAERVGNLPWAMREMAERNHRRLEAAASVLNNVILPLVLLAYALPAAVIVIGLFVPIIHLIQALV